MPAAVAITLEHVCTISALHHDAHNAKTHMHHSKMHMYLRIAHMPSLIHLHVYRPTSCSRARAVTDTQYEQLPSEAPVLVALTRFFCTVLWALSPTAITTSIIRWNFAAERARPGCLTVMEVEQYWWSGP